MSRVVVVGSGAREHALAWRLAKEADVIVTPGSDGMRAGALACTTQSPLDLDADLFVIGPEIPLVAGLGDALRAQGKAVLGPNKDGARLEGSKAWMKELCDAANVPTAAYGSFRETEHALVMLRSMRPPYVVKTDGLAGGKGVLVTDSLAEAEQDAAEKLAGRTFGDAGQTVVIEEGLFGEECSLLVLCDGARAAALPLAQDYKRLLTGGTGPNTGGMGAFAPYGVGREGLVAEAMGTVVEPTLRELRRRGIEYRGILFAGLMLTKDGLKLLEFNVRFGDPETQVVVPLLGDSLETALSQAARGLLVTPPMVFPGAAVTVILAAAGYPEAPRSGDEIAGLGDDGQLATPRSDVAVFHAGTRRDADGRWLTAGGRVLSVTAVGRTVGEARSRAYDAASTITFAGRVLRTDVGSGVS